MVLCAVWGGGGGATKLFRATGMVFIVLAQGHHISPVMYTRYERVRCIAVIGRTIELVLVVAQDIRDNGRRPATACLFSCALQVFRPLAWQPLYGSWCSALPGQTEPLYLV